MILKAVYFDTTPDKEKIRKFLDSHEHTQLFAQKCFFGKRHLKHTLLETKRAFDEKRNISNSEEIEFLLILNANRQISKAISNCTPQQNSIFVSWNTNAKKIFSDFSEEFQFEEQELTEQSETSSLDAIEKSATFYI